MWRIAFEKELSDHRGRLVDVLTLVLVCVSVFPFNTPQGFLILGALIAVEFAARLAGDETLSGTREFMLTRPMRRIDWFRSRFVFGLTVILLTGLTFLIADGLDAQARFVAMLTEGSAVHAGTSSLDGLAYLGGLCGILMVYALTYSFAIVERKPDRVLAARFNGIVAAGILYVLITVAGTFVHSGIFQPEVVDVEVTGLLIKNVFSIVAFLGIAALSYSMAARAYVNQEIGGEGELPSKARTVSGTLIFVLVALLVAGVLVLFLSMTSVRVQ